MLRYLIHLMGVLFILLASPTFAQQDDGEGSVEHDMHEQIANPELKDQRTQTGGAQTLEDILRRQQGQKVDDSARRKDIGNPDAPPSEIFGLRTLGSQSDSEIWRALRYNEQDLEVSTGGPEARVLIQDTGMKWLEFRKGPLLHYGNWFLVATVVVLLIFFLVRGRVRIDGGRDGRLILRFRFYERLAHWTLAGSFILLGLSGLLMLSGRFFIMDLFGKEFNASLLQICILIHNNIAWLFIIGLIAVFVLWVAQNIPNRTDLRWIAQGGGIIGDKHPPARKFNAGQKVVFWSVILFGTSIAVSGLSLLFPYDLPLFAKTFSIINDLGLPDLFGFSPLPTHMPPQEEMQLAQAWHAIMAFVMMAIIIGHIYIGTLGMEGAFEAMGSGDVDLAWAEQHHSLWVDEMREKDDTIPADQKAHPAE